MLYPDFIKIISIMNTFQVGTWNLIQILQKVKCPDNFLFDSDSLSLKERLEIVFEEENFSMVTVLQILM